MENSLDRCREYLESVGVDYLDVGCNWQENSPMTLAEKSDIATGLLLMVAQLLFLYVLTELAREHFKKR